jgi:hypothetical protein
LLVLVNHRTLKVLQLKVHDIIIIIIIMKTCCAPVSINEMLMAQRHNNANQFLETNMILHKLDNNDTMYW